MVYVLALLLLWNTMTKESWGRGLLSLCFHISGEGKDQKAHVKDIKGCWLNYPCGLLSLSYRPQDHQHRDGPTHNEPGSLTLIINQKLPPHTHLPTGQSDGGNSSIEVITLPVTLVCIISINQTTYPSTHQRDSRKIKLLYKSNRRKEACRWLLWWSSHHVHRPV